MNLLAALLLATASARVEAVNLTTVDSQLAVRVALSGRPGMVSVHREGETARASRSRRRGSGRSFAGGTRFAWTPAPDFDLATLAGPMRLDRLEVVATATEVSVLLHVPPEISIDVRRDRRGLRPRVPGGIRGARRPPDPGPARRATSARGRTGLRRPSRPARRRRRRRPEPATAVVTAPAPEPIPSAEPAAPPALPRRCPRRLPSRHRRPTPPTSRGRLFPAAAADARGVPGARIGTRRLGGRALRPALPGGAPQTTAETVEPAVEMADGQPGVRSARSGFRGASISGTSTPTRSSRLTGQPVQDRLPRGRPATGGDGPGRRRRSELEYAPVFRAFATYRRGEQQQPPLSLGLDLPVGPAWCSARKDRFLSGILDTREVDPGRRVLLRPRASSTGTTFDGGRQRRGRPAHEPRAGGWRPHRSASRSRRRSSTTTPALASAGLGYELSPNLRAIVSYSVRRGAHPRRAAGGGVHRAQRPVHAHRRHPAAADRRS